MKQVIHTCLFVSALIFSSFTLFKAPSGTVKIKVETPMGNIVAVLYDETPLHRDNFLKNIKEGVYNNLLFHRCIQEFMIQGGDPDSREAKPGQVLGNGGLNYTVPAEFRKEHFHKKGALAAARMGDDVNPHKASSSTQFYIVQGKVFEDNVLTMMEERNNQQIRNAIFNEILQRPENAEMLKEAIAASQKGDQAKIQEIVTKLTPAIEEEFAKRKFSFSPEQRKAYTTTGGAPHLDGAYTVFGEVIEGLDVIDKIAAEKTDGNSRPLNDIRFSISIVQ